MTILSSCDYFAFYVMYICVSFVDYMLQRLVYQKRTRYNMLMAIICPTVTAYDTDAYYAQMHAVSRFSSRVHVDVMDGIFAPTHSPELEEVWWPYTVQADIHLMYQEPMQVLEQLVHLRPHMVIVHNEASVHHMHFAAELHKENIKAGLAILQDTPVEWTEQIIHSFDHVLVFSGDLGHHGGHANIELLSKVAHIRRVHPEAEIGWDGGITAENSATIAQAGVDVLNVGSSIHGSENSEAAYDTLVREIKHT